MVDVTDRERLAEAKTELEELSSMINLEAVLIMVLGNKIDRLNAGLGGAPVGAWLAHQTPIAGGRGGGSQVVHVLIGQTGGLPTRS